jgi:hypothetical protein
LAKERTDTRCENVREVLTSWMVTFQVLETSMSDAAARVQHMEDHLVTRSKELLEMLETAIDQAAIIHLLQERVGELELGHGVLRARMINIEVRMSMVASLRVLTIYFLQDRMDVDLRVKDLTGSDEADGENSSEEPLSGLSSDSGLSSSGLYDDGRQTFLSVPVINVDVNPAENVEPIPVCGPSMAMLPGPSVLRSLVPIEEEEDLMNDPRFIPPSLRGGEVGPDMEVKEESGEETGKVAGTPEFWADYD